MKDQIEALTPVRKSKIKSIPESEQISDNSKGHFILFTNKIIVDTEVDSKFQTETRKSNIITNHKSNIQEQNKLQLSSKSAFLLDSFHVPMIKQKQITFLNSVQDFTKSFKFGFQHFFNEQFTFTERLQCHCDPNLSESESCSLAKKWMSIAYNDAKDLRNHYFSLLKLAPENLKKETIDQINKDLNRTCPSAKYFQQESTITKLKNVLQVFAIIDNEVSYVQGINFIAAALLYHAEEYAAF